MRDRRRVVTGALRRDLEAAADRVVHDRHDVAGVGRERDERRTLVDPEVPRAAREVPLRLVGGHDVAGEDRQGLGV
jgi:hypothetical protein